MWVLVWLAGVVEVIVGECWEVWWCECGRERCGGWVAGWLEIVLWWRWGCRWGFGVVGAGLGWG